MGTNDDEDDLMERDEIMTPIAKPSTRVFRVSPDKVDQFVKRGSSCGKTMERFRAHKPKSGVVTPSKGKHA